MSYSIQIRISLFSQPDQYYRPFFTLIGTTSPLGSNKLPMNCQTSLPCFQLQNAAAIYNFLVKLTENEVRECKPNCAEPPYYSSRGWQKDIRSLSKNVSTTIRVSCLQTPKSALAMSSRYSTLVLNDNHSQCIQAKLYNTTNIEIVYMFQCHRG